MANRYWNPSANANWGDANVWATVDGGDPTGVATPTSSDDVYFTSTNVYNCTINTGGTRSCKTINTTGGTGYTGTLTYSTNLYINGGYITFGANTINTGTTYGLNLQYSGTVEINSGGASLPLIAMNAASQTVKIVGYDLTCFNFTWSSGASAVLNANNFSLTTTNSDICVLPPTVSNLVNLSITGYTNYKLGYISLKGNLTASGTITIYGTAAKDRLLVKSDTLGTARTISAGTILTKWCDWQDITTGGAADWDLRKQTTNSSGDCGGNTGLTCTDATTTNWESGATWSTATWSVRVPLPQDTATFTTAGTQTITQDMPRIGSVNFTGSSNKTWTTSTACSVFGSINLTDLATLTNSTNAYTFEGRGTNTITTSGKTWGKSITIDTVTGTVSLGDKLLIDSARTLKITTGTFNANNMDLSIGLFSSSNSNARSIIMGNGVWEISGNGNIWNTVTNTNLSFNSGNSTIKLIGTLTSDIDFNPGSLIFYNFWNATSGNYIITIRGSNTFNDFKIDTNRKVNFFTGTTNTVSTFTTPNTGTPITIRSSSTTNATLAKAGGGVISCDYIDIDYITGSPDDTWYMGTHSTDGGHNSQIYFTDPPATTNTTNFFMFF